MYIISNQIFYVVHPSAHYYFLPIDKSLRTVKEEKQFNNQYLSSSLKYFSLCKLNFLNKGYFLLTVCLKCHMNVNILVNTIDIVVDY